MCATFMYVITCAQVLRISSGAWPQAATTLRKICSLRIGNAYVTTADCIIRKIHLSTRYSAFIVKSMWSCVRLMYCIFFFLLFIDCCSIWTPTVRKLHSKAAMWSWRCSVPKKGRRDSIQERIVIAFVFLLSCLVVVRSSTQQNKRVLAKLFAVLSIRWLSLETILWRDWRDACERGLRGKEREVDSRRLEKEVISRGSFARRAREWALLEGMSSTYNVYSLHCFRFRLYGTP